MADIQASAPKLPPLYVRQGKPITRTRRKDRPDWLDDLKRPIRYVETTGSRVARDFMRTWGLDETDLVQDMSKLPVTVPLLVFPGAEEKEQGGLIEDISPIAYARKIGRPVIPIPACAVINNFQTSNLIRAHFPIETNLMAETVIAIAEHRALDALNGK